MDELKPFVISKRHNGVPVIIGVNDKEHKPYFFRIQEQMPQRFPTEEIRDAALDIAVENYKRLNS